MIQKTQSATEFETVVMTEDSAKLAIINVRTEVEIWFGTIVAIRNKTHDSVSIVMKVATKEFVDSL